MLNWGSVDILLFVSFLSVINRKFRSEMFCNGHKFLVILVKSNDI
jgi:hypothetical protein